MRRILMLTLVSVVACSHDSAPAATDPTAVFNAVAGVYGLATVNGAPMPQEIGEDGIGIVDVLSGTIELKNDASYVDVLILRERGPSGLAVLYDTVRGNYLHFENTLLLRPAGGGDGSFFDISDANTLVASNPGFSLVYRR